MDQTAIADDVVRPPASVEDYNEMGQQIGKDEIAAVEAADLAFDPPED